MTQLLRDEGDSRPARPLADRVASLALVIACLGAPAQTVAEQTQPVCDRRCILVATTKVKPQTYAEKVSLTGGIEPKFTSNIAFRVTGRIAQRLVEIGDHVTADQVIAKLDPKDQEANLDTAKATLASAEALLTQAKTNFERQEKLYNSGYTTRPAYDQAQQQLRVQQAAVDNGKAALGEARTQLGYTDLKPGVAGIVTARDAETGQVVQAGQTVMTLAQDGPRDAVFDLYEGLLAAPPPKGKIALYLQADPNVKTQGTVREIAPTVDTAAGTVKVKVGLDTVPERMSLGAAVVGVGAFAARPAFMLPRSALFRWHDAPAVWLIDPTSRKVSPKVVGIQRYAGDTIVLSQHSLTEQDVVVTAGTQFLYPGLVVGIAAEQPK